MTVLVLQQLSGMRGLMLILLILVHTSWGQAQVACRASVAAKSPLQIEYAEKEVLHFLRTQHILPERILTPILERVDVFRFQNEDMGNAILISALSALGRNPSRQKDLIVKKYLSPLFQHYLVEFQKFTAQLPKGWPLRVPNLFELSKLGFKADAYGTIHWGSSESAAFLNLMKVEFSKTSGFDLVLANRLLVQMAYLHSSLSGSKGMTFHELKAASDDYFFAESFGHVFMPTVGEWNIANVTAQWHLHTTVNMLPKFLDGRIQVHGGDGLSSIMGITHDHSHLIRWRLGAVARGFDIRSPQISEADAQIANALQRALKKAKQDQSSSLNPEMLGNTVFFFVHEPASMQTFIQKHRSLRNPWEARQFAKQMREALEKNAEFYPMMRNRFAEFETTYAYLIQLIARAM